MHTTRALLALATILCFVFPARGQGLTKVTTIKPERKAIRQVVEQPAGVEAFESTAIHSKVSGYVERVAVDMGDKLVGPRFDERGTMTAPGQVLAVLALPELTSEMQQCQAAVQVAHAQVEQAYAAVQVSEAKMASARTQVAIADANIRSAQASVLRTRSEFTRLSDLLKQQAIAEKVVDEAQESLTTAQSAADTATAGREASLALVRESEALLTQSRADHVIATARVKVAEAALAQAQATIDYGTIRAPFTGIVSKRNVHTGHLVQPGGQGAPLFEIARVDVVRVMIDVPELVAPLIDVSDPVTIRFPNTALAPIDAPLTRLSWTLDKVTRTLKAEVDLPNPQGSLRPGMYAYASIIAAERSSALVLPTSAVFTDKQQSLCACVEQGKIVRKVIQPGIRTTTEVEIVAGLDGSEAVVRANASGLAEGQAVETAAPVASK